MSQNLEDWILSQYGQENYTPGLERIDRALESIRSQLQSSRIVIIAGTNGKGETTHRLSRYLKESTFCAWTSPHIESITERFSSEAGDIPLVELTALIRNCHELCKTHRFRLTYYEFLFFVFCHWAIQKKSDYLLLEVGLGGRLDAVNSLSAELVVLTSISRDHQEFLGNRYELILKEKLGVLRPLGKLISFLELDYLRERTSHECRNLKVNHIDLAEIIKLPGFEFSLRNQFLAYAAFCTLKNIPIDAKTWIPSSEKLAFRGEIIKGANDWWLFGSHNVDGMRKLIQFLSSANYTSGEVPFNAVVTSFSKRNEKDLRVMLRILGKSAFGQVWVTSFDHPKAYPKEALKDLCSQEGLQFVENVSDLIHSWTQQKVLVVGSYYFLGQLKPLLRNR